MGTLIQMPGPGRKWSPLESKLAASLVFKRLRDGGPATYAELQADCGIDGATVLHAVTWMRGKGVEIVFEGGWTNHSDPDDPDNRPGAYRLVSTEKPSV